MSAVQISELGHNKFSATLYVAELGATLKEVVILDSMASSEAIGRAKAEIEASVLRAAEKARAAQ